MKKGTDKIHKLIELPENRKEVFTNEIFPMGIIKGLFIQAYYNILHIILKNLNSRICKRLRSLLKFNGALKVITFLIILFFSINTFASDFYITTSSLNIRSGAGKNFKSLIVLEKGDTVKVLSDFDGYWVMVQYQDIVGYSAKQYLQPIEILVSTKNEEKESNNLYLTPLTVIALIIVVIIILKKAAKTHHQNTGPILTQSNISMNMMTSRQQKPILRDESIIDISSENLNLSIEKSSNNKETQIEPPFWEHTYVFSYGEIEDATPAQKKFYFYFKNRVINGEFVDICGYTNYAFILYFDLLNEYQSHRDIRLLDEQFKLLGQICPKTKNYSFRSLQDELRRRNDSYSIEKLKELEDPSYEFEYRYSDYNPDLYKLGNQYKDKLGLDKQEISWLNKFYNPANVFLSIEGCCVATIMMYVTILKEVNKRFKKEESTLTKEINYFKDKLKSVYVNRNLAWGYYDASYLGIQAESDIYLTLFKRVENSVRESFGHKRKVSSDFPHTDKDLSDEFEKRVGITFNELLEEFKGNLGKPDLKTQIELNVQNVNRWQIEFDELKKSFEPELKHSFIEGIVKLEETNQKNPNIENIFFEASKFIAAYDKVQSLSYYAKYIYYDLKSKNFDNRELTKTVQKSLFKAQEQLDDFKVIIAELIKTSDINAALDKITKIYIPKRKKIYLDESEIKEVVQKHEGTVELLNEYLNSEKEETFSQINNLHGEDIDVTIIPTEKNNSIFISEITIGLVQEELIKKIATNSFKIHQDEVEKFANENQMFKNQLIDSINEACDEFLDGEALIEEEDDNYIMEESYYKVITK